MGRNRPTDDAPSETWVRVEEAPTHRTGVVPRPDGSSRRRSVPAEVLRELAGAVGQGRAGRLAERLAEAERAYERERYADAARVLRSLAQAAPGSPTVRQLYGLTLYRQGRWADALRELEAYRALTGSFDAHPVLADVSRALGRHEAVEELWDELRQASPSADLVAEGRIVTAGSLADRGRLPAAIALLERPRTDERHPRPRHLRIWYALADLYERAGDLPRARELFRRVAEHDPDLVDVAARVRALG